MEMSSEVLEYVTAEAFLAHPAAQGPSELVRGRIRMMSPGSGIHGLIVGRIFVALSNFVNANQLGACFPDNVGFRLDRRSDRAHADSA
jgi:Uma2 family endonuclease